MISAGLKFTDGSSGTYAQTLNNPASFDGLDSETRVVWCRIDTSPAATRNIVNKGGGGHASNLVVLSGSPNINFARQYSTTTVYAVATLPALNGTLKEPWFCASVLNSKVPSLYGGTLNIPATEASSYTSGPTTGVGTIGDTSANTVKIGGFPSAFSQGFPGVIWFCAWFPFAMSLAQLRDVQYGINAKAYAARALGWWYPGREGSGPNFKDYSGNNHPMAITGAVPTPDCLPRILHV